MIRLLLFIRYLICGGLGLIKILVFGLILTGFFKVGFCCCFKIITFLEQLAPPLLPIGLRVQPLAQTQYQPFPLLIKRPFLQGGFG